MNRCGLCAFFCIFGGACAALTGCYEQRDTGQDFLARRKAIIAGKRRQTSHAQKVPSGPGNRGYIVGGDEYEMVGGWMPQGPPEQEPRSPKSSQKKKPSNPATISPKRTKITVGE